MFIMSNSLYLLIFWQKWASIHLLHSTVCKYEQTSCTQLLNCDSMQHFTLKASFRFKQLHSLNLQNAGDGLTGVAARVYKDRNFKFIYRT